MVPQIIPASDIPHQLLERLPLQQICRSAGAKHRETAPAPGPAATLKGLEKGGNQCGESMKLVGEIGKEGWKLDDLDVPMKKNGDLSGWNQQLII